MAHVNSLSSPWPTSAHMQYCRFPVSYASEEHFLSAKRKRKGEQGVNDYLVVEWEILTRLW